MDSAHEAKWIYDELGINLSDLGCITPDDIMQYIVRAQTRT